MAGAPPANPTDPRYQQLPDLAAAGIQLFNQGKYFEAHEALEAAWRAEPGPVRELYRGILQVAVACHHLERGNLVGARKMMARSKRWLSPFSGTWQGVDVSQFKADSENLSAALQALPSPGLPGAPGIRLPIIRLVPRLAKEG